MNNAELYHASNILQKTGTIRCLEDHVMKIKWNNCDRIVDIGCGDGSVTSEVLKPYLPSTFETLIGCDISEEMIKFAKEHYSDERTNFRVLDIEDDLPNELHEGFNHVFSFYVLHWIRKQEQAFSNIYRLLSNNGDCLLIFLKYADVYDVFRILAKTDKWYPWLKDVELFVSPYQNCSEPEKKVVQMMEKIGFKNIDVKCKQMSYTYNSIEILKSSVKAVNPFKIPNEMYEDFFNDYLEMVIGMSFMDKINNNSLNIKSNYTLLIVSGSK